MGNKTDKDSVQASPNLTPRVTNSKKIFNIFISYCWGCRRRNVIALADRLKDDGFDVWIDRDKMSDKISDDIVKGIEKSQLVLMFFSDEYIASDSCREEANYALKVAKKVILPVNMTGKMPAGNWLALILQDRLWINFANEYQIDRVYQDILERIRRFYNEEEGLSDIPCYSFHPVNAPNFSATGYYSRPEDEERIFKQIIETCENPGSGVLVISGDGGVGKTTTVARFFVERKPRKVNTIVLWLNCFRWRETDKYDEAAEKSFCDELIRLSQIADPAFNQQNVASIVPFFKTKNYHVLFVFDDVFNAELLQRFVNNQGNSAELSCCAITRDPIPLTFGCNLTRQIEKLNALSTEGIKAMLENFYEMKGKLSAEKLFKLAESCCGLPLIASLIFAKFKFSDAKNWPYVCDKLLREELKNLNVHDKMLRPFKTVSQLFQFSIEQLDSSLRQRYNAFLFFDPALPIPLQDLDIFWRLPVNSSESCEIVEQFEQRSLVRRAERTSSNAEDCYLVHQMLWEAARDLALKEQSDVQEEPAGLQALRHKLVIMGEETVAFEVVHRLRRHLLRQIISKFDAEHLATICVQRSSKKLIIEKRETQPTFIHFLYKFSWPDDVILDDILKREFGCNHSYRLIGEILLKIKRTGNVSLLKQLAKAKSDEDSSSFITALFDDEGNPYQSLDRAVLLHVMRPWKTDYEELKWRSAALKNGTNLVRAAIQNCVVEDADIKELPSEQVHAAFIAAARCNSLDVLKCFTKKNRSLLSMVDSDERTALHFAATRGHTDSVRYLVQECQNSLILMPSSDGMTPLHNAAHNGHLEIVRYLVELEPKVVSVVAKNGWSPIFFAAGNDHYEIVRFLNEQDSTLISYATTDGRTILHVAAGNGNIEIVRYVIQQCPKLVSMTTQDKWTGLHCAASHGHVDIVRFFGEEHSSVISMSTGDGWTALHLAANNGHHKIVRYLVERHPNLISLEDVEGQTAFHLACFSGYLDIARLLFEKEPKLIETRRRDGWSALHLAATSGHLDVVRYLAGQKLSLLLSTANDGRTALHLAAENGHVEIVRYFIALEPGLITMVTNDGKTALRMAAKRDHVDIIYLLGPK